MTAVLGTFSDARAVKTRSVFQIIVEIPLEQADSALKALGGWPQPGSEKWIGLALAKEEREPRIPKHKRPWDSLSAMEQAVIRCTDPDFQEWLPKDPEADAVSEQKGFDKGAAIKVRKICKVSSRKEFDSDAAAFGRWQALELQYQSWLTDRRYEQSRTR